MIENEKSNFARGERERDEDTTNTRIAIKGKKCTAAAIGLSFMHILSVAGTTYQIGELPGDLNEWIINYGIWLCPILVVILLRRECVLVGIASVPILVIFVARMYYVCKFSALGINSMIQKGDWAVWITTVAGAVSAVIVTFLLIGLAGQYVGDFFNLIRGRSGKRGGKWPRSQ